MAAVWKITPKMKTQVEAMRARRRPMLSARNGELRAPKKVPAERMDTMAEVCDGDTLGLPCTSM